MLHSVSAYNLPVCIALNHVFCTLDDSFAESLNNLNPIHLILDTSESQVASKISLNLSLSCFIPAVIVSPYDQIVDIDCNVNDGKCLAVQVGFELTNISTNIITIKTTCTGSARQNFIFGSSCQCSKCHCLQQIFK